MDARLAGREGGRGEGRAEQTVMTHQHEIRGTSMYPSDTNALAEKVQRKRKKEQTLLCDLNIQAVPANSCVQGKIQIDY